MDPNQIVQALKAADPELSEIEIARRLTAAGTRVSQSTINRIATGETTNTSYRVGRALEQLHRKVCGRRKGAAPIAVAS